MLVKLQCLSTVNRLAGTLDLLRKHTFGGCRKAGKLKISIQWQRPGAHAAHAAHHAHGAHPGGHHPG